MKLGVSSNSPMLLDVLETNANQNYNIMRMRVKANLTSFLSEILY
jgi:hypothetical protein